MKTYHKVFNVPEHKLIIFKYNNRKLYNTETNKYVTLTTLPIDKEFVVIDRETGDDITDITLIKRDFYSKVR
jgi:polyhydroxyalkanoate synthesis regulator protein